LDGRQASLHFLPPFIAALIEAITQLGYNYQVWSSLISWSRISTSKVIVYELQLWLLFYVRLLQSCAFHVFFSFVLLWLWIFRWDPHTSCSFLSIYCISWLFSWNCCASCNSWISLFYRNPLRNEIRMLSIHSQPI